MKTWKPADDDGGFEMTPMIDIVFLLITFFMTVTSYANAELVQVVMPIAPEAKVPEDVGDRQFISIAENGTYFLGAFKSDLDQIEIALKNRNSKKGSKAHISAQTPIRRTSMSTTCLSVAQTQEYTTFFSEL